MAPLFFSLLIAVMGIKKYFFDMPAIIQYEQEAEAKKLYTTAAKLAEEFSYYLKNGDRNELLKVLGLLRADRDHYRNVIVLHADLTPKIFSDANDMKRFHHKRSDELFAHNAIKVLQKRQPLIIYDPIEDDGQHFDAFIPLVSNDLLYVEYSIAKELEKIQNYYSKEVLSDLILMTLLLFIAMYLNYFFGVKKLRALAKLTRGFSMETPSVRSHIKGFSEIESLSYAFNRMAQGIEDSFSIIEEQNRELKEQTLQMRKFQQTVEQSPLMVMMTDAKNVIEYVNPQLLLTTGYSADELIGKTPEVLHSGKHDKSFYQQMWRDMKYKGIWEGEFINRTKEGAELYEQAQLFPIFDETLNITHYIAIKQDITERLERDKILKFQTKQAQMGEMISMIAHQWRQPLASINAVVNSNLLKLELDTLDLNDLGKDLHKISGVSSYLSETINDFRNFFKPDKEMVLTSFDAMVNKSAELIIHSIKTLGVELDTELEKTQFLTYEGEILQVILNLLKNSLDIYESSDIKTRKIRLFTESDPHFVRLIYQDNAGGCSIDPIEKIFAPYFTTKDELQGTGLGLYMSKTIIEEHCLGTLSVRNIDQGIEFTIELPILQNPLQ